MIHARKRHAFRLFLALCLGLPTASTGAQPVGPIFAERAEVAADTYRFFVIGHAYGAHTRKPKIYGPSPFPAASLLANLDMLADHDLGFFVGDVVEACGSESLAQFKRLIADRLSFPIFNAKGNHDNCPAYDALHRSDFAFTIRNDVFVVLSAMRRKQIEFLAEQVEQGLAGPTSGRVFLFTHRPFWATLAPELRFAGKKANVAVKPDPGLAERLTALLSRFEAQKGRLYWFSGDVAAPKSYPVFFHRLGCCIELMATGLYDNGMDNFLRVEVGPADVRIEVRSLTGETLEPLARYDVDWLKRFFERR